MKKMLRKWGIMLFENMTKKIGSTIATIIVYTCSIILFAIIGYAVMLLLRLFGLGNNIWALGICLFLLIILFNKT